MLHPHLPINQYSAFTHWRYWSHAPRLMTAVAVWYAARVDAATLERAAPYTHDTVLRVVALNRAFLSWRGMHHATCRAVSMTNHLQRRLCATLLLRVVFCLHL